MPNKFISFDDAINLFTQIMCKGCEFEGVLSGCETTGCQVKREIIEIVNKHPPADVRSVVSGKWIVNRFENHTICECGACGHEFYYHNKGQYRIETSHFCPNCGAKNREEAEDE